ncbi:hypothetical protein [Paracidovorax cattleyae]|uniref:Uncharacterized protein n=1 Tax=Paracidovorax cattleyae TaxID=80868 RepID=A0A1H0WHC9_9BURK|nr:hypothetical protein [Paracidovorax cattleyae]MBF9263197.1 hypothetical protein [Paracidovorax cattleyae]SDP90018.1 hypothetical protein SAMN04489708_13927 [Paracidovorax cattleyae]
MHLIVPYDASAHPHHAYATATATGATAPQIRSMPFARWLVERLAGLATGH